MSKQLNIAVLVMLDLEGKGFSLGGLQRWCRDVAMLGHRKGYRVTVYQKATRPFQKEIAEGVSVHGLVCPQSFRGNWVFCRELLKQVDPKDPILFVTLELALSNQFRRAVGVEHGIWWNGDHPAWRKWCNRKLQYRLVNRMRSVICVDTNYINWCHAELSHRELWNQKLHYVPNYADLDLFLPMQEQSTSGGPLTVLFPRRVNDETIEGSGRGAALFLQTLKVFKRRNIEVKALIAGPGRLQGALREWGVANGMEDRLEVFDAAMDNMPSVYARADVVVVPSVAHEGTSLSAVEAIVSGKPTVVSHIGGLGNIVINGLNGHICDLSPESLADAIQQAAESRLLDNPEILARCRESLGKPRWERQVWGILQQCLDV